ncbi:hypothetical protein [Brevibacillus daliensis]|uniref:hypothetical protein n=1 Tax=Brevibacillus daliensis TaxID=2892995 RepID=UPI001E50D835|nr:hypothetical protein [Brevibacillus daliensis]
MKNGKKLGRIIPVTVKATVLLVRLTTIYGSVRFQKSRGVKAFERTLSREGIPVELIHSWSKTYQEMVPLSLSGWKKSETKPTKETDEIKTGRGPIPSS